MFLMPDLILQVWEFGFLLVVVACGMVKSIRRPKEYGLVNS